ncbi:MAG: hypothetical protein ACT4QC_17745 [Planctomycetaceae bacterium]
MTGLLAGDLLAFYGRDWTSRLIEAVTWGPSHVGIVSKPDTAPAVLFESTTLCDLPDQLTGRRTTGVQAHVPADRIAAYRGRVALLRLAPVWQLSREESRLLAKMLRHVHGAHYDFGGAVLSGTRIFKWTALVPYGDLGSLFCSELCAAVLMRLGRLPIANPAAYNPAGLVRALRRAGVYQAPLPLTAGNCEKRLPF